MPTLRGSPTTSSTTFGSGITIAKPTGLDPADTVVVLVETVTMTDPAFVCAGFTEAFFAADNTNNTTGVSVLVGTGHSAGGNFTITSPTYGSGDYAVTICVAYQNVDTTVIGSGFVGVPDGTPAIDVPGITSTVDGAELLIVGAQAFAGTPAFTAAGYSSVSGLDGACVIADTQTTAGATGDVAVTTAGAFSTAIALLVALQPAPPDPAEGSVTGAVNWVGTVTGRTERRGAVAGAVAWVGAVTGATVRRGAVAGAVTWGPGVVAALASFTPSLERTFFVRAEPRVSTIPPETRTALIFPESRTVKE